MHYCSLNLISIIYFGFGAKILPHNRKVYLLLIVNLIQVGMCMIVEISIGIITIGTAGYVLWQLRVKKSVSRSTLRKISRALKSEK